MVFASWRRSTRNHVGYSLTLARPGMSPRTHGAFQSGGLTQFRSRPRRLATTFGEMTQLVCSCRGAPAANGKWPPLDVDVVPVQAKALPLDTDVVASPEFFGDGLSAFRQVLFRSTLAGFLHSRAKRIWNLRVVTFD